jgi:uncharacterized membrane protein YphA (DoxX/SURF4 family)
MKAWLLLFLRVAVGVVFLFSGIAKLFDLNSFTRSLDSFKLFPPDLIAVLSHAVPIVEGFLGTMLVGGIFTRYTSRAILGLLLLFSGIISVQILTGNTTSCNCFGRLFPGDTDTYALFRNTLLAFFSYLLIKYNAALLSFDELIKPRRNDRTFRQIFIHDWLELSTALAMLALIILFVGLLASSLLKTDRIDGQTHQEVVPQVNAWRSQFASLNEIKRHLMRVAPGTDSIYAVVLNANVELFELYLKNQLVDRYIAVIENSKCKSCEDLHFAVKLTVENRISNILFFTPIDERIKSELIAYLRNTHIQRAPGVSYSGADKQLDAVWRYFFFKGLRDASDALRNTGVLTEASFAGRRK